MDLLRRFFGGQPTPPQDDALYLYVRCGNCGRTLRIRVDKRHDLLTDYDNGGFTLVKEMMDDKCFRLMRAELAFDRAYTITSQRIEGGTFITKEEYEQGTGNRE